MKLENFLKVSVIVPIYNAERYLEDTLNDIATQTLKDIEIICVDDGSTDKSHEILESFMEKDSRIMLITQKNQNSGVARNNGMSKASGEYVVFWDSDDRFDKNALELMYQKAVETNADICICGVDDFDSETGVHIPRKAYLNVDIAGKKQPFNRYDIPEYIFNFTTNHVWNKMYRMEFVKLHGLQFGTGDFSEETMFVQPSLYYAERICYVEDKLVYYRRFNSMSAVMNQSAKKSRGYKGLYDFYQFVKETGEYDTFEVSLHNKLLGFCIDDLESNNQFELFSKTYYDLKEHVFCDFGLTNHDESFYRTKLNYIKMRFILVHDAEDYLLWNMANNRREMLVNIAKTEEKLSRTRTDLQEIKKSASFRIGRMITFLPRKIKNFQKNR